MKAFLKNYRQSPRKVRLVAGLIKGKRVADAFVHLGALSKRASDPINKLLVSAVSNAKQAGASEENLYIENLTVNKGVVLKRSRPRARGSASRINKRTSHVMLNLSEKVIAEKKAAPVEKPEEKKVEKVAEVKKEEKKVVKKTKVAEKAKK